MEITRYGVYWVRLNPTTGSEISKTRPCVVVSPEELNKHLNTVIVIPVTSKISNKRYRVRCYVDGTTADIATDHIRAIDKRRIAKYIENLSAIEIEQVKSALTEMFE
jgi:mRNA interferase MazF